MFEWGVDVRDFCVLWNVVFLYILYLYVFMHI